MALETSSRRRIPTSRTIAIITVHHTILPEMVALYLCLFHSFIPEDPVQVPCAVKGPARLPSRIQVLAPELLCY